MKKRIISCIVCAAVLVCLTGNAMGSWLSTIFETTEAQETTEEELLTEEPESIEETSEEPEATTEEESSPVETLPVIPESTPAETEPPETEYQGETLTGAWDTPSVDEADTDEAQTDEAETDEAETGEPPIPGYILETEPDYYNLSYNDLISAYKELLAKYNSLIGELEQGGRTTPETEPAGEVIPVDEEEVSASLAKGDFLMLSTLLRGTGWLTEEEEGQLQDLVTLQVDSTIRYALDKDRMCVIFGERGNAFTGFHLDTGDVFLMVHREEAGVSIYSDAKSYTLADYEYALVILSDGEMIRLAPEGDTALLTEENLEKIAAQQEDPEIRLYGANGSYVSERLSLTEIDAMKKICQIFWQIRNRLGVG